MTAIRSATIAAAVATALLAGCPVLAGEGSEAASIVGVAVPAETLQKKVRTLDPPTQTAALPLEPEVYTPSAPQRRILVGRDAWLAQKFAIEPLMISDHGRPEIVFE